MPLPPHAQDWMNRAEIDYIGPFVKAWAAFNAWYRHASAPQRDERGMLDWVKTQPNPLRRGILALLREENTTSEGQALKLAISDLQTRLDAIHFEVNRKGVNELISLRSVCITPRNFQRDQREHRSHRYVVEKVTGGHFQVTVMSINTAVVTFQHSQALYEPNALYALPDFTARLSEKQRETLKKFYDGCNPRPMRDLLRGEADPLPIGVKLHGIRTPLSG